MASDVRLIAYDYVAGEHKDVALDPDTKALLVKEISPPPTDHGELAGLDDDDHTQYVLVDGSRALTGLLTLSGAPTADLHAATKKYIDDKPVGGRDKQNLVVKVNAANPTYQIDIDADILQVEDENLSSINLTVNLAIPGANGLDTGSEAANTWYSIWVIRGTSGTAGLLSTSATSPSMPAGYTKKRRVGWVRNNASSNFWKFYQIGDWWHWDIHKNVLDTSSAATAWTDVACSSGVPPTSELILISVCNKDEDSAVSRTWIRRNGSSEDGAHDFELISGAWGSTAVRVGVLGLTVSCDASQIIEYKNDPGDDICSINIQGYYDPI